MALRATYFLSVINGDPVLTLSTNVDTRQYLKFKLYSQSPARWRRSPCPAAPPRWRGGRRWRRGAARSGRPGREHGYVTILDTLQHRIQFTLIAGEP